MIQVERLTKHYGDKVAVDKLDLYVEPGEIVGFLGPNGAGKSTTVKVITGLIKPDSGRTRVCGFDVVEQPLEVKKRVGYVPETPALYDSLTAGEYLELVSCLHHLETASAAARRHELLDLFGLASTAGQRLNEFSKGMRQKVVIAAALLHRPDVLILDEPLDGLDANTAMVVKELLKRLAAQGKTIMFSSHILDVVERICTRIVIINDGQNVASGTAAEIRAAEGVDTLEEAFSRLTGVRNVSDVTSDFLAALERV
ncbi:MAG TPA: ABC transporter ATP-binding protein [Vicinamibacterales bacterium]|nr:ABC transporter ATP-binding protein [Vicinamibacterales bacterium]